MEKPKYILDLIHVKSCKNSKQKNIVIKKNRVKIVSDVY